MEVIIRCQNNKQVMNNVKNGWNPKGLQLSDSPMKK